MTDIYSKSFVTNLFNEMSRTYGVVNYISSFGFTKRWRRQGVARLEQKENAIVYDLMSGMGEALVALKQHFNGPFHYIGVDLSDEMCRRAEQAISRLSHDAQIVKADILENSIVSNSADVIFSSFGLKTFSNSQLEQLAHEVSRILKPGGQFVFVEIAIPQWRWFQFFYLFYLQYLIPLIGRLFLGNPDNYRMLAIYTKAFGSAAGFAEIMRRHGLYADQFSLFFGCGSGVVGNKGS